MTEPIWTPLQLKTDQISAKPLAIWTLVCDYVKGPLKLKVEATGTWDYSPSKSCGPDGSRQGGFPANALNPSAPLGALIGKIGGSTADKPLSSFVIGSYTVIALDDKAEGPLYFTMNDQIEHFDDHDKFITIVVQQARG